MKMLMKGAAIAALATVAMASAANAATFVGNYTVNAYDGNSGLEIETYDSSPTLNFNLASIGSSAVQNLFKIWTNESSVDGSDTTPRNITVHFNFTSPTSFGGDMTGSTFGEVNGKVQDGKVTWNDPLFLSFSGGQLKVTMDDVVFNKGDYLNEGYNGAGQVTATFQLLGGAVPEPATWAMMITGFGMAGVALRRRRYAGVAA